MGDATFHKRVLDWYDTNLRILPWRDNKNPFYIWVSEIMLQQTKVQTVIPYYERFISEIPNVQTLALISDERLLKLWEGLGYYNRVRNMKKAAIQVMDTYNGVIPKSKDELERLSGIGPYTSGAITSIAFDNRNPAIDGNVLRVFARLYEIKESIKDIKVKKKIRELVEEVLPFERIGDFNQGLMEIGAVICVPNGKPKCEICPLKDICVARKHNTVMAIPIKNKKKKVPIKKKTVLLMKYNDTYAVMQRPTTGLLSSMYQFPMYDNHLTIEDVEHLFDTNIIDTNYVGNAKHKFSHLEWNIEGYMIKVDKEIDGFKFISYDEMRSTYPIPSAFDKFKLIIKEDSNE